MSLVGENVTLKRDAADKDKYVAELEEELRSSEEKFAPLSNRADTSLAPSTLGGPPASRTELELLHARIKIAEGTSVMIGHRRDGFRDSLNKFSRKVGEMFFAVHGSACPMERARQCLLRVCYLYRHVTFRLGDSEEPARDFIDRSPELFGQECSRVVARADLDAAVAKLTSREAE